MRLIKMLGLAATAALAVMAFMGASSASAAFPTSLCRTSVELECPLEDQWLEGEVIHLLEVEPGKLLSSLNILCLTVLGNLQVEGASLVEASSNPDNQLKVKGSFHYLDCGTTAAHSNCTVTELEEALVDILKTGVEHGVSKGLKGRADVHCTNILGFITIDCEYDTTELDPLLEGLHVTIKEAIAHKTGGGGLCPEESKVDALLESLEETPAMVAS